MGIYDSENISVSNPTEQEPIPKKAYNLNISFLHATNPTKETLGNQARVQIASPPHSTSFYYGIFFPTFRALGNEILLTSSYGMLLIWGEEKKRKSKTEKENAKRLQ